ncbi:hypothetical protein ACVWDN_12810, partial [Escherichia coli]
RTELRNGGLTEPARRVADLLNIGLPDNATSYTLRDIIEALPNLFLLHSLKTYYVLFHLC